MECCIYLQYQSPPYSTTRYGGKWIEGASRVAVLYMPKVLDRVLLFLKCNCYILVQVDDISSVIAILLLLLLLFLHYLLAQYSTMRSEYLSIIIIIIITIQLYCVHRCIIIYYYCRGVIVMHVVCLELELLPHENLPRELLMNSRLCPPHALHVSTPATPGARNAQNLQNNPQIAPGGYHAHHYFLLVPVIVIKTDPPPNSNNMPPVSPYRPPRWLPPGRLSSATNHKSTLQLSQLQSYGTSTGHEKAPNSLGLACEFAPR